MKFENLKTCGSLWGNNSNSTHVDWWTAKHHFSRPRHKQDCNPRGSGMRIVVYTRNLLPVSRPRGQPSRYLELSIVLDRRARWLIFFCTVFRVRSVAWSFSTREDVHATVTVRVVFPIIWGVTGDWSGSGKQVSLMLQRTAISLSIRLRISQWVSWTVSGSLWQAVWCWVRKFALSWQHPTDYRKQLSCALE